MVHRLVFQIPFSLLFLFFSPQPRTAIWPHLKHFASHLLSLGRDLGSLLHTVILSLVTPVLGNKWGGRSGVPTVTTIAPWHPCKGTLPTISFCKVCPHLSFSLSLYIYNTLFKHHYQFISVPNGHRKILMGYL